MQHSEEKHNLRNYGNSIHSLDFGNQSEIKKNFIIDSRGSEWDEYLDKRLSELCGLNRNWDGYESIPVTFKNARQCFTLINGLKNLLAHSKSEIQSLVSNPPFLVPVSGGALQAEWHLGSNFIELFFDEPSPVRLFAYNEVTDWETETEIDSNGNQFNCTSIINCFQKIHVENCNDVEPAATA